MQRQTTLSIWCERVIEAGWLLALALIPIYFNLLSARHFEPDKATTLRGIVLIMVAAGLVRVLEHFRSNPAPPGATAPPDAPPDGNPLRNVWRRFASVPLAVPALVYALVFLFTTFTSVVPLTSFWGSYQRLQGTYTNLSYIGLFAMIVVTLRRREQLERLITVALVTGLVVAGYGLLQHFELDPLPWRGDVITRVASTMGNSIFVAAYMIMIVPLGLYRAISAFYEARQAPAPAHVRADLLWALAHVLLLAGTLALLLSTLKFGAVVRTVGLGYWWVFPGAIVVSTALWSVMTLGLQHSERRVPLWPGLLFAGYFVFFWLIFGLSMGRQVIDTSNPRGLDWWAWMLGSALLIGIAYAMVSRLPRTVGVASRMALWLQAVGAFIVTLLLLVAIFFTQSRGPWIGLGAGLFVFFLLLLMQAIRRARLRDDHVTLRWLRIGLWSWMAVTLLAGVFLIIFNISDAPFFQRLREVPYIGRMGRLLEVNSGTGLVRRLIWFGDEHAGGAVELITDNPVRMFIGWGPESMFVAFNPYYPPLLTSVESRGASPDRAHQAILDELVTKGVIGLASYLFVLISFFILSWRLMRRSEDWRWQVLFIACFSIVVAHFVEGLTGIPIVSTLMMLWVTLGITVTGGMLAGHYALGAAGQEAGVEAQRAGPVPAPTSPSTSARKKRRGAPARGAAAASRTGSGQRAGRSQMNPAALGFYAVLLVLTLGAIWWFNVNPIYADMRFQQGQAYSEQPNANLDDYVRGMTNYVETIRSNPREDFYYLNLGRTLMNIANQMFLQGVPLGEPRPDAQVADLLRLQSQEQVISFVQSQTPLSMMSYAEAVLEAARELNELNKDHYANLGRLNNFWYSWTQDPARLQESAEWYRRATELAPQDVTLLNERASVTALLGSYAESQGDAAAAQAYFNEAEQLLQHSRELDDRYQDTNVRLADLYRLRGQLAEATDLYVGVIQRNPHQLDQSVERIAASLSGSPELLRTLRDAYAEQAGDDALLHAIVGLLSVRAGDMEQAVEAYEQATALQPQSLEYRRNYTLVLSDTRRYDAALSEAQNALSLAQSQNVPDNEVAQLQALVSFLQQRVAGGQ